MATDLATMFMSRVVGSKECATDSAFYANARRLGFLLHGKNAYQPDGSYRNLSARHLVVEVVADAPKNVRFPWVGKSGKITWRTSSWAKWLRRLRGEYEWLAWMDDEFIERVATLVGKYFPKQGRYTHELLRGEAIRQAYMEEGGPDSCMVGGEYLDLYVRNPDRISLIKITDTWAGVDDIDYVGRALLWECDDGTTVLDRVYPTDNGPHMAYIHAVAEREGWVQAWPGSRIAPDWKGMQLEHPNFQVTVRVADNWPYLDTFYWSMNIGEAYRIGACFTLMCGFSPIGYRYEFSNLNGSYTEYRATICEICRSVMYRTLPTGSYYDARGGQHYACYACLRGSDLVEYPSGSNSYYERAALAEDACTGALVRERDLLTLADGRRTHYTNARHVARANGTREALYYADVTLVMAQLSRSAYAQEWARVEECVEWPVGSGEFFHALHPDVVRGGERYYHVADPCALMFLSPAQRRALNPEPWQDGEVVPF
jgi:hypothetical protein